MSETLFTHLLLVAATFVLTRALYLVRRVRRPFHERLGIAPGEWAEYRRVLGLNDLAAQRDFVTRAEGRMADVARWQRREAWRQLRRAAWRLVRA